KASPKTLADTDELLKLVKEVQPKAALNYNKHYIGLEIDGVSRNFVAFRPRKNHVIMEFKLSPEEGEDMKQKLEGVGMTSLAYDTQFGYFRVSINPAVIDKQREVLRELVKRAWERFGRP